MSEWISVKDRLPEYDSRDDTPCEDPISGRKIGATLTSNKVLVMLEPYSTVRLDRRIAIEGGISWWDEYGTRVTHWMPLPEPPKKG